MPPPPGTGVTSSPTDPLWGWAPLAFISIDTNGTGLAMQPSELACFFSPLHPSLRLNTSVTYFCNFILQTLFLEMLVHFLEMKPII